MYAGLRADQLMGNFHFSDPSTPTSGSFDADQALSVSFSITAALSTHQYVSIQCAVLYTTADGRRLVRVINLALQVTDLAGNVFRFAETDVVIAHLMRQCKSVFHHARASFGFGSRLISYNSHVDCETVDDPRRANRTVLRNSILVPPELRRGYRADSGTSR